MQVNVTLTGVRFLKFTLTLFVIKTFGPNEDVLGQAASGTFRDDVTREPLHTGQTWRENGTGTYLGLLLVPLGRGRAPGESVMRGVGVSMGVGGRVGVRPAAQTVQRGRS